MSEERAKYKVGNEPERTQTDFASILEELRGWGLGDYEIARQTGINRSRLSKLRSGEIKQTGYDDGVAIMAIYKRESKKHT